MSPAKRISISKTKKISPKKPKKITQVPKKDDALKKKAVAVKRTKIDVRIVGRNFKREEELEPKGALDLEEEKFGEEELEPKGSLDLEEEKFESVVGEEVEEKKKFKIFGKKKKDQETEEILAVEEVKAKPKSIGLYRKISFSFILLTIILIAVIFYFSFVNLTIYVTPKQERISDKLIVNIYNNEDGVDFSSREYVKGVVEQIPVVEEKTYQATGAQIIGEGISGKIQIINNYNQSQILIATTRFLSADGKLFRIKERVNVPAGESVEVEIYTDEPSQEMAIEPTEFTIPGLWAGLQDKIYAKSDKTFIFEAKTRKYVQQVDIDKATQDLKSILIKKVGEQFGEGYKGYDKIIYEIDKNSIETEVGAKVGEEKDKFNISIKANVNIVGLKSEDIEKMAREKLVSVIPNDKKLVDFDSDKIEYSLGNYNLDSGVSGIEATFAGTMVFREADNVINKEKIVGLSEEQLKDYLVNLDKFNDFEIVFFPTFIKKAPSLVDKIKIKVK